MTLPEAFAAKRKVGLSTMRLRREAWPDGIALSVMEDHPTMQRDHGHVLTLVISTPLMSEAAISWTPAGEDLRADDWEPA